jgi:hypothetical protein
MTTTGTLFQELAQTVEFIEFAALIRDLAGISVALNTPDLGVSLIGVPGDLGNPICRLIRGSAEDARRMHKLEALLAHPAITAGRAYADEHFLDSRHLSVIPATIRQEYLINLGRCSTMTV